MISADDLKPGLFVAVRFVRARPVDDLWCHVAHPAAYRVVSVALPYALLEEVATGVRVPFDTAVFEFEHLRPEFVEALHPGKTAPAGRAHAPARAAARDDGERDAQGYRRPERVMTIKSPGQKGL